jgi:hypothetical protein
MKKYALALMSLLVLAGFAATAIAAGQYDHIITAADVEKLTGLTGVKQVPREPLNKFRNGDLNFVTKTDQPLLMIQFRPGFMLETLKADSGYFKAAVKGIGDEAFTSPSFDPQFSLNFRKGQYVAIVTTDIDPKDKKKTMLSMDQLTALAKLVASRM